MIKIQLLKEIYIYSDTIQKDIGLGWLGFSIFSLHRNLHPALIIYNIMGVQAVHVVAQVHGLRRRVYFCTSSSFLDGKLNCQDSGGGRQCTSRGVLK